MLPVYPGRVQSPKPYTETQEDLPVYRELCRFWPSTARCARGSLCRRVPAQRRPNRLAKIPSALMISIGCCVCVCLRRIITYWSPKCHSWWLFRPLYCSRLEVRARGKVFCSPAKPICQKEKIHPNPCKA